MHQHPPGGLFCSYIQAAGGLASCARAVCRRCHNIVHRVLGCARADQPRLWDGRWTVTRISTHSWACGEWGVRLSTRAQNLLWSNLSFCFLSKNGESVLAKHAGRCARASARNYPQKDLGGVEPPPPAPLTGMLPLHHRSIRDSPPLQAAAPRRRQDLNLHAISRTQLATERVSIPPRRLFLM